jgi:hypothetical protein
MLVGQLERMGAIQPAVEPAQPVQKSSRQVAEEFMSAMREHLGDEGAIERLRDDPELADRLRRMMKP